MSLIKGDMGRDSIVSESKLNDCVCLLLVCGNGIVTFLRDISMLDRDESRESNDVVFDGWSLMCSTTPSDIGIEVDLSS